MRKPRLHPRVLGYLGRALSLEYSAVQQYMTQAVLTEAWGLAEPAARLRHETVEELRHAERIVQRMLQLGVAPNASQLRPAGVARNLVDLLLQDVELEAEIVALYAEAAQFCARIGDDEQAAFFDALWREEVEHAQTMHEWLAALGVPLSHDENERAYF